MAAELIPIGTGVAQSADIVVTADAPVTIGLKWGGHRDLNAQVIIMIKDDAGQYNNIGSLFSNASALVIAGPGTYRLERTAGSSECGAYSA